jgi:hypothetical protein
MQAALAGYESARTGAPVSIDRGDFRNKRSAEESPHSPHESRHSAFVAKAFSQAKSGHSFNRHAS